MAGLLLNVSAEPETTPSMKLASSLVSTTLQIATTLLSTAPEPEAETTSSSSAGRVPSPEVEPTPRWDKSKEEWGVAWPIHWIGFSALFIIFSAAVAYAFVKMVMNRQSRKRATLTKFSTTVWTVLLLFGVSRALYLLMNPYENGNCVFGNDKYCPLVLNRVLYSLGLPGLTTAFLLFHFAFLEVAKIKGAGRLSKLQSTPFLVASTIFNYAVVMSADLIVTHHADLKLLVTLCQAYFIVLGLAIMGLFMYSASGIFVSSKRNWNSIQRIQDSKLDPELAILRRSRFYVTPQLQKVIRLTLLTVGIWAIYVLFQCIALTLAFVGQLTTWPYLIMETFYRLCELLLGCSIFYAISARPSGNHGQSSRMGKSTKQSFSRKYTVKSSSNASPSTYHSEVKLVAMGEGGSDTASHDDGHLTNGSEV